MLSKSDIFLRMEDSQEIFVAGIKKLMSAETKKKKKRGGKKLTVTEIADYIGVSPSNLSGFLNFHRNYSEQKRVELSGFFGKSYMDVLEIGRIELGHKTFVDTTMPSLNTTVQTTSTPNTCPSCGGDLLNKKLQRHQEIIQGFSNHNLALEITQLLVEYEKLKKDQGLIEIRNYVAYQLEQERLKRKEDPTGTDENKGNF